MKQQLWIFNSSLMFVFFMALMISNALRREPSLVKITKVTLVDVQKKKEPEPTPTSMATAWEKIYQDDIFDTYVAEVKTAVKQSFITPIPEMKAPAVVPPPEPKKQEFVPPLPITLKGIIISSDEAKNAAMIADETNKEALYHLGDMVKDAIIVKIAKNRVVFLRANGQQEVFYLRKDDNIQDPSSPDRWKLMIKKVNDQLYDIDQQEFMKEIESLGHFMERVAIIGTVFNQGIPVGIRLGKIEPQEIGGALGLVTNDILVSVNGIPLADPRNRVQAYESAIQTPFGGMVKAVINRMGMNVQIAYRLTRIEKPKKYSTIPGVRIADQPQQQAGFPMSKIQQREQTLRDFSKTYDGGQQQQTIMDIRRRLFENLRNRMLNARQR
jgi:type II secretion system protein C